jgi:hypothetical protein
MLEAPKKTARIMKEFIEERVKNKRKNDWLRRMDLNH